MSKRTIRLTESDLKNIIKESVNNILNEDYNYKTDFEDGGSAYDRDTYGMDDDEIDNWQKEEHLDDKRYRNDNYESLRSDNMNNINQTFIQNMEDKIFKNNPRYEKLSQSYRDLFIEESEKIIDSINNMRRCIRYNIDLFQTFYKQTGDERYLVAAKTVINEYKRILNVSYNKKLEYNNQLGYNIIDNLKFKIFFNTEILKDYSPLSKDKVYSKGDENGRHYNRLATTKDRRNGYQGNFE